MAKEYRLSLEENKIVVRTFASTGLILETGLLFFYGHLPFFLFFLVHGLAIALLGWAAYVHRKNLSKRDKTQPVVLYLIILAAFLPMAGTVAALLFCGVVFFFMKQHRPHLYDEYEQYLTGQNLPVHQNIMGINVVRQARKEISFQPLTDILIGTDLTLKTKAIAKLSRIVSAESIHLLKLAMKDPSPEIRMYAAGALVKVDEEMNDKIQTISKQVSERGQSGDYFQMGDLCQKYAELGILDPTLSRHYLEQAAEAYRKSLDLDTNQPATVVHYGQIMVSLGDFERAKILIDRALKLWPEDVDLAFLRNEIYFRLGHFSEIADGFRNLQQKDLKEARRKVVEFWTQLN